MDKIEIVARLLAEAELENHDVPTRLSVNDYVDAAWTRHSKDAIRVIDCLGIEW